MKLSKNLSNLIQRYFSHYLIEQRNVSRRTIAAYQDTFKLLFTFAIEQGFVVEKMALDNLDEKFIVSFLQYLEEKRGNSIRTRNHRLSVIHSFLHYAALQEPSKVATIQQGLAIPQKSFDAPTINCLTEEEIKSIIHAPNLDSWSGQRDQLLFILMYNTGARVSEIIHIRVDDIDLVRSQSITLHGKGRKERTIPLWKQTIDLLKQWIRNMKLKPTDYLFSNRYGNELKRGGVELRLKEAVKIASKTCISLKKKKVSPHVIRHTTALHLLHAGVDLSVVALWLGHENINTTHHYIEVDLATKEKALGKMNAPNIRLPKYKPTKNFLAFLDKL